MSRNFYITTTLPYVNSDPHVGFAMEIIRADIIARYKVTRDFEVFFNTGTDEHGSKIFEAAEKEGINPQAYTDRFAEKFKDLKGILGLWPELNFIRTTDPDHVAAAQEFWKLCDKNGYIYKKNYSVKYCVGCELEKTDSELVDGRCPIHPNREIELISEENYFFRFSQFQLPLLELYGRQPDLVVPDFRFNEIKAFVNRGLEDFSISRLKTKMPWGVAVPGDDDHVMYVWFDALVNYISAIGWPNDMKKFEKWWPVVQYCGKDNLRQQSAMWQAMLMAAGLPPSRQIVIDGFITGEGGVKMSKSLGNVINPLDVVNEYGTDALRYYVAREIHPFEDSIFTMERFRETYNAGLANGLGNLVSRVMKMAVTNGVTVDFDAIQIPTETYNHYSTMLDMFEINKACETIWSLIQAADKRIQDGQPFKLVKTDPEKGKAEIKALVEELVVITKLLVIILPTTAAKIKECIVEAKVPDVPLFLRK